MTQAEKQLAVLKTQRENVTEFSEGLLELAHDIDRGVTSEIFMAIAHLERAASRLTVGIHRLEQDKH